MKVGVMMLRIFCVLVVCAASGSSSSTGSISSVLVSKTTPTTTTSQGDPSPFRRVRRVMEEVVESDGGVVAEGEDDHAGEEEGQHGEEEGEHGEGQHGEEGGEHGEGHAGGHKAYAVLFPVFVLVIGLVVSYVLEHYAHWLPYTAVMLLLGAITGLFLVEESPTGQLAQSFHMWSDMDSGVLLLVFLPGLMFKDALGVDFHLFTKSFFQIMWLAFPMVLFGTVLTAGIGYYIFPYGWSFFLCMTFGAILAATDPVAVSALLNAVGSPPRLKMHISGESMFNDGSAIVFFIIFRNLFLFENGLPGGEEYTVGSGDRKSVV